MFSILLIAALSKRCKKIYSCPSEKISCLKEELVKRIVCVSRDSKFFQPKDESNIGDSSRHGMCYGPSDRLVPCSKYHVPPKKCISTPFNRCSYNHYLEENSVYSKFKGHYDT